MVIVALRETDSTPDEDQKRVQIKRLKNDNRYMKQKKSKIGKKSKKGSKNSTKSPKKRKGKGKSKGKVPEVPSMEPSPISFFRKIATSAPTFEPTYKPTVDDYPNCDKPNRQNVGDGWCDDDLNIPACGWDGGDCPAKYPNCIIPLNDTFGDGFCDEVFNLPECGYDDGDCEPDCSGAYNGYCEKKYNIAACSFDGGDCDSFNAHYPDCNVPIPWYVGDGICDTDDMYNSTECGFDGGDCAYYNSTFNNSTNTTNVSLDTTARRLFQLILDFFYPKPDDEVLDWQK